MDTKKLKGRAACRFIARSQMDIPGTSVNDVRWYRSKKRCSKK